MSELVLLSTEYHLSDAVVVFGTDRVTVRSDYKKIVFHN